MTNDELHVHRLFVAFALAVRVHGGQVDKAGAPYLGHVVRVADAVGPGLVRVVALLHDVVEDGGATLDEIVVSFGHEVGWAVDALTRLRGETYEAYIERCAADALARVVKLADLADNTNLSRLPWAPGEADLARQAKYAAAVERLRALP